MSAPAWILTAIIAAAWGWLIWCVATNGRPYL